jgi:hypothetical protein
MSDEKPPIPETRSGRKGGRPRKHDMWLNSVISLRLSEADHVVWNEKVDASGLTASAFFREAILANQTQIIARAKSSADKTRLLYLFNKTSNNMNQLAHRANVEYRAGILSESTYARILAELAEIRRVLLAAVEV